MAITFFTHSIKENSPIWIRIRESKIDAKARTLITIPTDRLVKGKILLHRITSGELHTKDLLRQKNDALNIIQQKMDALKMEIQNHLNKREADAVVNKQWLLNIIQPQQDTNLLSTNLDAFLELKKTVVKPNTLILYKGFRRVLISYEKHNNTTLLVKDVDMVFRDNFLSYLRSEGYSSNTIIVYIRTLVSVLKFAQDRGIKITSQINSFKKDLKKKKTLNVYLTLDEIETIYKLDGLSAKEDIARDWLVISCNIGQRASDLFKANSSNLNAEGDVLTVQQTKNQNSKPISIPLLPIVLEILKKYNGNFPPLLSDNPSNNYKYYNELIKVVCKKANLTDEVKTLAYKSEANNSSIVSKPKYELIGTHVGRRSFCTNLYGLIPTPLLMMISGHQNESTLLLYIDADRIIDLEDLRGQMINAMK